MSLRNQNLITTLNLLVLLYNSRKQTVPLLTEEQQHILTVTREHLQTANIDIPVFINTLNLIGRKGYFFALSIYEKRFHSLFKEFQTKKFYDKFIKSIESSEKNILSKEQKEKLYSPFFELLPKNIKPDYQDLIDEELTLSTLVKESQEVVADHNSEIVSYVLLLPYRKIESLLLRLENGELFNDIQDQEIWFDFITNSFHYNGGSLDIGKTKRAKEVFKALFSKEIPSCIYFDDIPEFDQNSDIKKQLKAYYDSVNGFINKDLKLKEILDLHQDRLEINPEYIDKAH